MATQRRMRSGAAAARASSPAPARGYSQEAGSGVSRSAYKVRKEVIDETDQQLITPPVDIPEGVTPAKVRVGAGLTISMGQFESLRVDVVIEMPCMPNEAAINETYELVSELVSDKLTEEQNRWLK